MKMSIIIFIFLSFISYAIQAACGINDPKSAADCKDETLTDTQKNKGYVKCCFQEAKNNENIKECIPITENQGKKLGSYIKEAEKLVHYAYEYSIDCKSSYLKAGLVLLISFIIF